MSDGFAIWLTGLPAAGKTTIAERRRNWCRSCLFDRSLRRMLRVVRTHAANRVYR